MCIKIKCNHKTRGLAIREGEGNAGKVILRVVKQCFGGTSAAGRGILRQVRSSGFLIRSIPMM
jgi:hypothetical protein